MSVEVLFDNPKCSIIWHLSGPMRVGLTEFCCIIYLLIVHSFGDSSDISRAWEKIRENVKITAEEGLGHHEWKQHK